MSLNEYQVINNFTRILGLENKTNGTLFIYNKPLKNRNDKMALKPDGYYYSDGVTFILDAKAEKEKFTGQLEDYMKLEKNENFIGFKYSGDKFECYVKGELIKDEIHPCGAQYYINKYLSIKRTNENIVEKSAKKLADLFRDSLIDKQMNVPFIGATMLCLKFGKEIINNTTIGILNLIKFGIEDIIADTPLARKQKKEFIKTILGDATLKKCKFIDMICIISEISTIYNFINVSDKRGHDTMNNFLKIFRKWNSANANEKGEVFTPDHIAQLMYRLINCNKDDTIMDPTCGSGTFLTNAMANMLAETNDPERQKNIRENHVLGIEQLPFNATLAGINMMLHGDGASNIFEDDCFKKLPTLKNCYNKVLMNPPFSQKDPELKFVLEALNNMTQNGLCATILPISCALGREYLNWRKKILDKHSIIKSIKLPKNLFEPNASTDTCICVFQAHIKNNNIIEKYDFSDDGFELKMRIGRVNINNEQKTIELFNSIPMKAKVTYKDDWLIEKKFDYSLITKIDFVKAKIDFNLINKNIMDELYSNNGNIALNINISDLPLQTDVWKEFKIKQLFDICGKGKDTIKKNSDESEWPCINAKKNNNGIGGFKNNPKKLFDGGKITVVCQGDGGAGMTYYQENKFCATSSVQILKPKYPFNKEIGIFISKLCSLKWKPIYSHGKSITNNILLNETIKLPTTNCGNPDWEFMTKYIKGE